MVTCAAYGCTSRSGVANREKKLAFFRFPSIKKDLQRRQAWIRAVRRENWIPTLNTFLCSLHFSVDQINFSYSSGPRLREGAIPNVFSSYPPRLQLTLEKETIMGRKRPLRMASARRKRKRVISRGSPTSSTVIIKEEPVDNIAESSRNTDAELEYSDPGLLKTEVVCKIEEGCQESNASQEEEEVLESSEAVFLDPVVNDDKDPRAVKVKEEPEDNIEECSSSADEELQYPASVFVKSEPVCEFEETFHNIEESGKEGKFQDGEEEVLGPQESVFFKPIVNDKEDSRTKKDSPASGSESGFLASIKQKIGKLFPGERTSNKSPTLEGQGPYADFICICNERFSTEEAAMAHTNAHDGAKPFRCLICREHFATKGDALQDMKSHIVNKYVRKTGSKPSNLYTLLYKQTMQADGRPVQCYICNKNFTKKDDLIAHMRTHTGGKPFQCDVCAKFFWQKCHLFAHTRIHTGEKPFQCSVCNKKFRQKANLVKHMNVHRDHNMQCEKDYQCKVCKKIFTQSGLKDHMLTHSGKCLQDEACE